MEGYILAGIPPFVSVGPLEKPNCLANPPRLPRGELCCDSGNTLTSEVYSSMDVSAMNSPRTENTAMILIDRKSTRLNSSHVAISYAVFCLKKKNTTTNNK